MFHKRGLGSFGLSVLIGSGLAVRADDAPRPLAGFTIPGVEPRAADADAPLAEGWPGSTRPGMIEVKTYPAYRGAVARAKDANMGSDNTLFYPLFLHITREKVVMTSPVVNSYDPAMIENPGSTGNVAMEFVYRTPTTGTAGPGLGAVIVEDHPAQAYVCLGVQGDLDPARLSEAVHAVASWLTNHKGEWVASGPPRRLGYHAPMVDAKTRLWEVQIPIRKVDAAQPARPQP